MNCDYFLVQFEIIAEYLRRAKSLAQRDKEAFLKDKILVDAGTREITVLFETRHNIAKHLISEKQWRAAHSKAEAFEVLAENSVIDPELADSLCQASRFRNLVTYQTARVDDHAVYEILVRHIDDFEQFAAQAARWRQDQ